MFRTAALLLLSTAALAQSPARVASLDWMSGNWIHEDRGQQVMESWVGPGNGLMVAANLSTWPDGRKTYEFLRIVYWRDGDTLAARIEGTVRDQARSKEWRFKPARR